MKYDITATKHTKKGRTLFTQCTSLSQAKGTADQLCALGYDVTVKRDIKVVYSKLARLKLIS